MNSMTTSVSKPIRVAIYSRVSTEEQVQKGVSLTQQPELIEQELIRRFGPDGYEIVLRAEDPGMSGSSGPSVDDFRRETRSRKVRPGLRDVLRAADDDLVDAIAVCDLSRLYRNASYMLRLFEFLTKRRLTLISVSDPVELSSAAGELSANMLAMVAQFQRRQNNERVKANLDRRREKGLYLGTVPYGWRRASEAELQAGEPKTIKPVPEQLDVVRRIARLFLQGQSEKKIADTLNAEGVRHVLKKKDAATGKPQEVAWDWQSVSNILKCPAHAGLIRQPNGSLLEGVHAPSRAYGREDYERILGALQSRRGPLRGVHKDRSDNLLSKLVHCSKCGQGLQFVKGHDGAPDSYVCRGLRGRGDYHVFVSAEQLDKAILTEMERLSAIPEILQEGETLIKSWLADELKDGPSRIRHLTAARERLDRQMKQALEDRRQGLLDDALFAQQRDAIRAELKPVQEEWERLTSQVDSTRTYQQRLQRATSALRDFSESWAGLEAAERRELVRIAIEIATITDLGTHNELHVKLGPFEKRTVPIPKARSKGGGAVTGIKGLTARELAALRYVLQGVQPIDAADRMGITVQTYGTLCRRAKERIGAKSVAEAAKKAAPWLERVEHLLPVGPWKPRRRISRREVTLTERIAAELYADGKTLGEIGLQQGLPESDVLSLIESAKQKGGKR